MKEEVLYPDEAYAIIGACFEVYNTMGYGFLEAVYQECLEMEFTRRNIPARSQEKIPLRYKGNELRSQYIPDFICFDKIVVEIKSAKSLDI